ncbi:DUF1361 domain-containing protein [Myxacorys almedinensis]|uniref:DUF1361 domain-containing protein n=1 Tax=Myxacorys almedinensis A TaxID=2690445 RepID=A0A8J7ZBW6_9CYAN|nr:DUF1361 domain-containing protein [Myxacorys almedinensis]NDJ19125.1 DUF1361 domain-containing protein [Myxacorys almedinensis A]
MITTFLSQAWYVLLHSAPWMGWNLFLAVVPLILSVLLFRQTQFRASTLTLPPIGLQTRHRSLLWWLGVVVFVAFLPNAPYILTDIIHFITNVQAADSVWFVTLFLIPLYVLFIAAGFEAYVLSLINLGAYLNQRGLARWILLFEMVLHALSAIGIYLGRFLRYNSWDLVTRLDEILRVIVDDLLGSRPILVMLLIFLIVAGLYALVKPLHLAVFRHPRSRVARHYAID